MEPAAYDTALRFLGWVLQNAPRNRDAHSIAVKAIDSLAKKSAAALKASDDHKGGSKRLYTASRKAVKALKYGTTTNEGFAKTLLNAKVLALAAADENVRQSSARSVFKLERLQVGMVAPDIEGKDLDGVAFKLSDYRGKAVVIDFWGDW